jgi:hypothetical protein
MKILRVINLTDSGFTETYTPLLQAISSLHLNRKMQHISKHIAEGKICLEPDVSYFESTEDAKTCVKMISTLEPVKEVLINYWTEQQQPFRVALSIDLYSFVEKEGLSLDYIYDSNKADLRYVAVVFDITAYENDVLSVHAHTCFPMSSMPSMEKSDAAIPAKHEDNQLNNIENNENSLRNTDLQSIDNIGKNDSAGIAKSKSYALISEIITPADSRLVYYVANGDQLHQLQQTRPNLRELRSCLPNLNHNIFSPNPFYLRRQSITLSSNQSQLLSHLVSLKKAVDRQKQAFEVLLKKLNKNKKLLGNDYNTLELNLRELEGLKSSLLARIEALKLKMIAYFDQEVGPVFNDTYLQGMRQELEETEISSYTLSLLKDHTVTIDNIPYFIDLLEKNDQDGLKVIALSDLSQFSSYQQIVETLVLLDTCIEAINVCCKLQEESNQQTLNCQLAVLKVLSEPVHTSTLLKNSSINSSLNDHRLELAKDDMNKNDAKNSVIYLFNPKQYFMKGMSHNRSISQAKCEFNQEEIGKPSNKKMILNLIKKDRQKQHTPPAVEQLLQIQTLEIPNALQLLQAHLGEYGNLYELAQQLDTLFFTDEINHIITRLTFTFQETCLHIENDPFLINALREKNFKHFRIDQEPDKWLPSFLNDFSLLNYQHLFEFFDEIDEVCVFFETQAGNIINYDVYQELLRQVLVDKDQLQSLKRDYPYAFIVCDDLRFNMDLIVNNLLYKLKFYYTFFDSDKSQKLGGLNSYMDFHLEQTQSCQKIYAPWPVVMSMLKYLNKSMQHKAADSPVSTLEISASVIASPDATESRLLGSGNPPAHAYPFELTDEAKINDKISDYFSRFK